MYLVCDLACLGSSFLLVLMQQACVTIIYDAKVGYSIQRDLKGGQVVFSSIEG